ncbi:hypothetical protein GCM10028808_26000 [Spirosoma migulaei]
MVQLLLHQRISTTAYLIGLLGFVLPFLSVSCQNTRVIKLTGVELITGLSAEQVNNKVSKHPFWGPIFKEWKKNQPSPRQVQPINKEPFTAPIIRQITSQQFFTPNNHPSPEPSKTVLEEGFPPNIVTLLSCLLGLVGFGATFLKNYKAGATVAILSSIFGLVAIWMLVYYAEELTSDSSLLAGVGILKIKKEVGFWVTHIAYLGAGINSFYLLTLTRRQLTESPSI